MHMYPAPIPHLVIHRIGGLEITTFSKEISICVIHRIGGLEIQCQWRFNDANVIHRIGGLEILLIRIVATMSELYTA